MSEIRQILALGGGGFSEEPENPTLDLYVLQQASSPRPRICFIGTATGDSSRYLVNFYAAFNRWSCRPTHLPLFQRTPDLRTTLLSQDILYVGGGNTRSMLAVWREWGLPEILQEAWEQGIVLAGISAGAICWFEQGITDSQADSLTVLDCLGMLPGSCCPHYDGEANRRPAFHTFLHSKAIKPGYALDNGVLMHFKGKSLHRAVSSRAGAQAYTLQLEAGEVQENPLKTEWLAFE